MRKYRNYSKDDIILFASQVKSMAQLFIKLGLRPAGGNYVNMRRLLQKYNIDCSHWTGQAWNKNKQIKDWSKYTRVRHIKKHLIKLRGHICESCKLSIWLNNPIKLEIHHIDGDRTNNNLINLQLLCPNCHAYTDGFRNPQKGF